MKHLLTMGRVFYGIGIAAIGIHQLVIGNFRPDILPPLIWASHNAVLAAVAGIVLILAGLHIAVNAAIVPTGRLCSWLGDFFLALVVLFHLPYVLIFSSDNPMRLDVWFGAGETLAYAGGAFVLAGSLGGDAGVSFRRWQQKLISFGGVFYSTLILLFAASHFVFAQFVSTMVPKWIGAPFFWTYFVGAALAAAGLAIILKIWVRLASTLLAIMLFLFFLLFHIPDAFANPAVGGGNEIVRAFVALLFCGIALAIAATSKFRKLDKLSRQ